MRWLLLINLLALVLLSGAVAIILEGTPIGAPIAELPSPQAVIISEVSTSDTPVAVSNPLDGVPPDLQEGNSEHTEGEDVSSSGVPLPLQSPRHQAVSEVPEQLLPSLSEQTSSLLKVGTEGDFAPFNFRDENGDPAGFDIDLTREVCRRIARECSFQALPWSTLQSALIAREVDLLAASMQIPPVVPEGVSFSDPYYGAGGRFVGPRNGTPNASNGDHGFPSPQTHIAVQQGSRHAAFLGDAYPSTQLVMTSTFEDALAMVKAGKVEGAFGDNVTALRWLKDRPCCRAMGQPLNHPVYFGKGVGLVARSDDGDLLLVINQALSEMIADGTYANLSDTYFGVSIFDE